VVSHEQRGQLIDSGPVWKLVSCLTAQYVRYLDAGQVEASAAVVCAGHMFRH